MIGRLRFLLGVALLTLSGCASSGGQLSGDSIARFGPPGPAPDGEGEVYVARTFIQADYDAVWDHLTKAELYEGWWTCPAITFGTTKNAKLLWGTPDCPVYEGKLARLEKGEGLAFSLRFVGFDFDEPATPIAIYARDRGSAVLVEVFHDARRAPQSSSIIGRVGWPKLLARLKTLLETGQEMEWPDTES